MAIDHVATMPEDWCLLVNEFKGTYDGNKVYLGRSNNLRRHVFVSMSIVFDTLAKQKEFFDWWEANTDRGGRPFYAKIPLYGIEKHYLLVQNKPFTQSVDTGFKITAFFMVYDNKTKDENSPPITKDVTAAVEGASQNNVILLDVVDPDNLGILTISMIGSSTGITIKGTSIIYTPPSGFLGTKTFHYKAFDGVLGSNTSTITIDVLDIDVPIAYDSTIHVNEGGNGNMDRTAGLHFLEHKGRPVTFTLISPPSGVTLPDPSQGSVDIALVNGVSSYDIKFKVNNGIHDSNEATTHIIVDTIPNVGGLIDIKDLSDAFHPCNSSNPTENTTELPEFDTLGNKVTYTNFTDHSPSGRVVSLSNRILKIVTSTTQSILPNAATFTANNGASTFTYNTLVRTIDTNIYSVSPEQGHIYMTTDGTSKEIKIPMKVGNSIFLVDNGSSVGTYSIVSDPDSLVTLNSNKITVGTLAAGQTKTAIMKITSCDGTKSNDFTLEVAKA